eukprot:TRINITY_DN3272_c0_g1_i2.p1 TRINITY_DN3272_c0_g1~~TRINITY_DN3272_c0_g1_i2.p1  ORF type:complete len:462 (+),score=58.85 TRINITY_DN3272_c0_g1_i2:146-1531(+)
MPKGEKAGISPLRVRVIVTIPAIWLNSSKQIMRKAALNVANIPAGMLKFALEPEAASKALCTYNKLYPDAFVSLPNGEPAHPPPFSDGTFYVVCDCGGGTVDCCVHHVKNSCVIAELSTVSGGKWGSTKLDRAFVALLKRLVVQQATADAVDTCKYKFPKKWQLLMFNWESAKRNFYSGTRARNLQGDGSLRPYQNPPIQIPDVLAPSLVADLLLKEGCQLKYEEEEPILLLNEQWSKIFTPIITSISQHLKKLLSGQHIDHLYLVGGFATSYQLQDSVLDVCQAHHTQLIVPIHGEDLRPGSCVVLGAALTGLGPFAIQRRSRQTYGISVSVLFDSSKHELARARVVEGVQRVSVFETFTKYDELIPAPIEKTYSPETSTQSAIAFKLLATSRPNPVYPDEEGVREVALVTVPVPPAPAARSVQVRLEFREEVIYGTFSGQSGQQECEVDFLYHNVLPTT